MTSPDKTSVPDAGQADEALAAAEEAEAEAAAAEALAAAATARARAIRLRRQADPASRQVDEASTSDVSKSDTEFTDSQRPTTAAEDMPDQKDADHSEGELTTGAREAETGAGGGDVPSTPATRSRLRWLRWPSWKATVATAAIVLAVALLAATGYMVWQDRLMSRQRQRSAEFAAAARQGVVTLMSLDFNHAKNDVQRIVDNSTGTFKKDFQATTDDFIKGAQAAKAVSKTTVNTTAVESMSNDSAVVLVAATSTVTNSNGAKDAPRSWRLSVTLVRDGGQPKIAKVDFVP